jgi:hypothetical protein
MTWYIGVFSKTGDEELVKRIPTTEIDSVFVKQVWSLEDDESPYGGCYDVTAENLSQVQSHATEKIDLNSYYYQLCDERDH